MNFQNYLDEIQKCLDNKCYMAAFIMSLAIPDVCGKALYPEESNGSRYKKWYSEYIGRYETNDRIKINDPDSPPWISADVIYSIRNCMFHDASPNLKKSGICQEENKIDRICIDFYPSALLLTSSNGGFRPEKEERILRFSANYITEKLLRCGYSFYQDHKEEIDKEYREFKDNLGNLYLWTN